MSDNQSDPESSGVSHESRLVNPCPPVPDEPAEMCSDESARPDDLVDEVEAVLWEAELPEGRVVRISRAIERWLGYPRGVWLSSLGDWTARVHPEDQHLLRGFRQRERQSRPGSVESMEYRLVGANGRALWILEVSRVVPGVAGHPDRLCAAMFQIGRRKKAERQLYYARADAEAHEREAQYLIELVHRLLGSSEWPGVLDEVLDGATALSGSRMGAISLVSDGNDSLRVAACVGLEPGFLRPGDWISRDDLTSVESPDDRHAVVVRDVGLVDPGDGWIGRALSAGVHAAVHCPLGEPSQPSVGILSVYFNEPHSPTPRQIDLQERYACIAGQIIAMSRRQPSQDQRGAALREIREGLRLLASTGRCLEADVRADVDRSSMASELANEADRLAALAEGLSQTIDGVSRIPSAMPEPLEVRGVIRTVVENLRDDFDNRGVRLELPDGHHDLHVEMDGESLRKIFRSVLDWVLSASSAGGSIRVALGRRGSLAVVTTRVVVPGGSSVDPPRLALPGRPMAGFGQALSFLVNHGGSLIVTKPAEASAIEIALRLPLVDPPASPGLGQGAPTTPPS